MTLYFENDAVTIYHGDCLDILPQLEPVDHVITDPPYARDVYMRSKVNNHQYKSASLERLAAGAIGAINELIEPASVEIARLTNRWGIVFSDAESTHLWRAALEASGLRYVRTGAWVKPDSMPQFSGDRPAVGFEPCTIVHAQGSMRWNGGGNRAIWTYFISKGSDSERPDHPCPKPLPLMRRLVEQFTDAGDTVLDPFAGSGTTGRAAMDLGRKAILIEKEERWCEVAAKRMSQAVLL